MIGRWGYVCGFYLASWSVNFLELNLSVVRSVENSRERIDIRRRCCFYICIISPGRNI